MRAAEMSAIVAASAGSRINPIVMSGAASRWSASCAARGGATAPSITEATRERNTNIGMLCYPDMDGFNGSEYGREVSKTSTPGAATAGRTTDDLADIFWQWSRFSELRPDDLYAVVRLREAVFIVEQNCPYPDADGRDPSAWHLLGWVQGSNERTLVAYARIFEPGVRYDQGSIGRVVTAGEVRRTGIGKALMAEALRRLESLAP